jgi:hypothetical protein
MTQSSCSQRATFDPYVGGYFQAPNARGEMVSLKVVEGGIVLAKRTRGFPLEEPSRPTRFPSCFSRFGGITIFLKYAYHHTREHWRIHVVPDPQRWT